MGWPSIKKGHSREFRPVQTIIFSFLITIIIGTFLLHLPISSREHEAPRLLDTFFISTSCTCVTGLTMFDTWNQWSGFGQLIMMGLIQLGGLGLITFTTGTTLLLRRRLGVRDLRLATEYTNGSIIDTPKLILSILFVTFVSEIIGALLLCIRFIPEYGIHGIFVAIFTSISAYCNAGFDILGFTTPNSSLCKYVKDPLINGTVTALIIVGGIGFLVIVDVYHYLVHRIKNRGKRSFLTTHTVSVLQMSTFLLIIGTVLFYILENHHALKGLVFFEKVTASFFQSTTARTAGFSTIPIDEQYEATKVLMIMLMLVGASPSSTGGGIKTTTLVVLVATVMSVLKGHSDTVVRGHCIHKSTVYKALSITSLYLFTILLTTGILEAIESPKGIGILDILFEVVSALGTVGLSTGITAQLTDYSKLILSIIMFIGRVGPISLVFALTVQRPTRIKSVLPDGKIIVG